MRKTLLAGVLLLFAALSWAQDLRSGPYELPYKNTYVKNIFVAENPYRGMKRETLQPRSYEQARKVLPRKAPAL